MAAQRPLAMITGATSGIGYELARIFAQHDYDVAMTGSSERIVDSAKAVADEFDVATYAHRADAVTSEGVESFWRFVEGLDRPVDSAVLNVGIGLGGSFAENALEDELRVLAVNVTGTVHTAKRVVQHMVPNGHGRILIVSSISAWTPTPYETVYGPSKAFAFSFAESLREELKDSGVSVTALLPGATDTSFHHNAGMDNTNLGPDFKKNNVALVAQQGFDALMKGRDHVVGGDQDTKRAAQGLRTMPETVKAARQAELTRPRD